MPRPGLKIYLAVFESLHRANAGQRIVLFGDETDTSQLLDKLTAQFMERLKLGFNAEKARSRSPPGSFSRNHPKLSTNTTAPSSSSLSSASEDGIEDSFRHLPPSIVYHIVKCHELYGSSTGARKIVDSLLPYLPPSETSFLYMSLCVLYTRERNADQSRYYFHKALDAARKSGDKSQEGNLCNIMVTGMLEDGQLGEVVTFVEVWKKRMGMFLPKRTAVRIISAIWTEQQRLAAGASSASSFNSIGGGAAAVKDWSDEMRRVKALISYNGSGSIGQKKPPHLNINNNNNRVF